MATGDLTGNLHRLQSKLRQVKYAKDLDYKSLARGAPKEFLPIIHYLMCDYSRPLTQTIHDAGIPLTGKTDQTFMEAVYKISQFEEETFSAVREVKLRPQLLS